MLVANFFDSHDNMLGKILDNSTWGFGLILLDNNHKES